MSDWERDEIVAAAWDADPVVKLAAPTIGPARQRIRKDDPLFVLGEGHPVPELFARPKNPNSAGHYPLGRRYSRGDEAAYRVTSPRDLEAPRNAHFRVVEVDEEHDLVRLNGRRLAWDLMGNYRQARSTEFDVPRQYVPAELYVGRKWTAAVVGTALEDKGGRAAGDQRLIRVDFAIEVREAVRVPAGTFEAFRARGYGVAGGNALEETLWYVPYLNFAVRWDREAYRLDKRWERRYRKSERWELVSARQFAIDG